MGFLIGLVILFALDALIGAAFLWIGMKVAAFAFGMPGGGVYCSYTELLIVVAAASAASLIPHVGWVASLLVLFVLLKKFTSASVGELVLMVVVSRLATMLFVMLLIPLSRMTRDDVFRIVRLVDVEY